MDISFDTERLSITLIESTDSIRAEDIFTVLTDKVTQFLPLDWQKVTTQIQAEQWLSNRLSEGIVLRVIEQKSSSLIGFIFLSEINESDSFQDTRLGYLISQDYWGVGLASEAIESLISYFIEKGRLTSITGGVSIGNVGSVKVLTKNGFRLLESTGDTEFYQYKF